MPRATIVLYVYFDTEYASDEALAKAEDAAVSNAFYLLENTTIAASNYSISFSDAAHDTTILDNDDEDDEPTDPMTDTEADADVLRSAGMGTDEDYGYYPWGEHD